MTAHRRYTLVYARAFPQDLEAIERRYHSMVRRTIEERLTFEPDRETRNRKPLIRPMSFGATWELRLGPGNRFRVLYRIDTVAHEIHILAVGIKEGNRLSISGEEVSP